MREEFYPRLGETLYRDTLPDGLEIMVLKKPGFSKKLAYFVTDFGSIYTEFTLNGEKHRVPAGVAHYLEHKMFDMPQGDITNAFSALGGVPNAFTDYDMTAYYFSCTENFGENLRLLLQFVSTPYFTEQSVQKEQGIIGQEIDMNLDSPDSVIFDRLMAAMYQKHPVSVPILGTRETIGRITPEILHTCHRAFYSPGNMLLCVVGDVDPEQVHAIASQELRDFAPERLELQRSWDEPMACPVHRVSTAMDVAMPTFQAGFKCEPADRSRESVHQEFVADLAAEALLGESSPLFLKLYQQGLIDSSFGGGFETVTGMAMLTASGDSRDPDRVVAEILQAAEQFRDPEPEDFLRMKRSALGRRLRGLDSFSGTCFRLCAYHFCGCDYFRFPELYEQITAPEITEFIHRVVTPERCCVSVITPL